MSLDKVSFAIDKPWGELSEHEPRSAIALGWTEEAWGAGDPPAGSHHTWSVLGHEKREAASTLGCDEANWNAELGLGAGAGAGGEASASGGAQLEAPARASGPEPEFASAGTKFVCLAEGGVLQAVRGVGSRPHKHGAGLVWRHSSVPLAAGRQAQPARERSEGSGDGRVGWRPCWRRQQRRWQRQKRGRE